MLITHRRKWLVPKKTVLAQGKMVLLITDDYSLSAHLSDAGNKLVVIDFYADWCGPCRYIAPIFERFAEQYTEAFFIKVNVDVCRQTSALYGVQAMPTFVFVKNNQEVDRLMGADASELERKIVRHITTNAATSADSQKVATLEERQFLEKFVYYSQMRFCSKLTTKFSGYERLPKEAVRKRLDLDGQGSSARNRRAERHNEIEWEKSRQLMQKYEDEVAQTLAVSVMPSEQLKEKSIRCGTVDQFELLRNLLSWFKTEFFHWVDTPTCESCGTVTLSSSRTNGMPTEEEKEFGANRVEVYVCKRCLREVRFPRYNDPTKLLETRRGRCGEWANCFALCCRALQLETRWIYDKSDHVWCEVWVNDMDRWVHCDPCENVIDTPLLYEKGWGKKLSYVIAFGNDHVRDVTWRYTFDHLEVVKRRTACREAVLRNFIKKLNARYERLMSVERKTEMDQRYLKELIEFLSPNMQLRLNNEAERQGRTTGAAEWREARRELGAASKSCTTSVILRPNDNELAAKFLRMEYNCAKNEYKRGDNVVRGWESLINKHKDVFRKEETDKDVAYLCRKEGKPAGELCWSFDLEGLSIKTFSVQLKGIAKYEGGNVTVSVCCGDMCNILPESGELTLNSLKDGRVDVKVMFTGGKGQLAWQHAQLFRSELNSLEPGLIVIVQLH
ncbi:Peptide-N(4)-(N-acetyl-beta-glucosaminyl)asparagine amidase [Toxocara canis]|uniref:Peptide-N(4)-(N-acetyl-beta-glucosaminyl)asparagine amidase n=1 Tax=Toxocara canis TaxID=6265 RepID=A0A0B2UVE2_TOXCA|nr:Peptide-N(4)-(N-acetyl-beta-glucosaminyl)asparagine amidase [Toxocara canis]